MIDTLDNDSNCLASWRARPRSFVALMSLYESNYVRLRNLLGDAHALPPLSQSSCQADQPVYVRVDERGPYTTTLCMTYRFGAGAAPILDPDLQVRVYRDACLAEALSCGRWRPAAGLTNTLSSGRDAAPDIRARWRRNMLLNKWLDYCQERGHIFAAT
jgi:uncharacterized protein YqiB (DUF1249 family)